MEQIERRNRVLTDADMQAIASMMAKNSPVCSLGLTGDDAAIIKGHLRLWKKATNIVGSVVLTTITVAIVGIFTKGFWLSLVERIRG